MRRTRLLSAGIAATLLCVSVCAAQDRAREADGREIVNDHERAGRERLVRYVRQRIDSVVPVLVESIERRYQLAGASTDAVKASVLAAVDATLNAGDVGWALTALEGEDTQDALIGAMLTRPGVKAALAENLSEQHLRDYLTFMAARKRRCTQAVARHLAAGLDRLLSLTVEQRQKIERLLGPDARGSRTCPSDANHDARRRGRRLSALTALRLDPDDSVRLAHERLGGRLDGVLSTAQSKLWQLLIGPRSSQRRHSVAGEEREDVEDRWEAAAAESVLAVHTEQLGPLDAGATRRLELARKGVVEQYVESREANRRPNREAEYDRAAGELRRLVAAGEITPEEMAARLAGMRRQRGSAALDTRLPTTVGDVPNHPLFQRTIATVLPADALVRYQAHQSERAAFGERAVRELVVAALDTLLLLGDEQRARIVEAVAKLPSPPRLGSAPAAAQVIAGLYTTLDRTILGDRQRKLFAEHGRSYVQRADGRR